MKRTVLLALLLPLVACKERTPTQIVLSVLTDLAVPAELDSVSIKVEHHGKLQLDMTHPLDPAAPGSIKLPATLALLPGPDRSQPVLITVAGSWGITRVAERRARLPFVEGRMLLVRLPLLRRCRGVPCTSDQTCAEWGCTPVDLDPATLPDYTPEEALHGLDASNGDRSKGDGPRPDGARPDGPRTDVRRLDRSTVDLPEPDQGKTVDLKKQDTSIKPDTCVPSCSAVCNANNGCGGTCSSDTDVESCTSAEYVLWRCVLSMGTQGIPKGTQISQVCQGGSPKGGLWWRTFYANPSDCSSCCGALGGSPAVCKP